MQQSFSLFLFLLLFAACDTTRNNTSENDSDTEGESVEQTFWVSGMKSTCNAGVGEYDCMIVSEGSDLDDTDWEFFYDYITDFDFKPGTMQLVRVRRTERVEDPRAPLMDASRYTYQLIKVLKQQPDMTSNIGGDWMLTAIDGKQIGDRDKVPTLMIDLDERRVSGNNSCNQYNGALRFVSPNSLTLGDIASTKKMCRDGAMEQQFNAAFQGNLNYDLSGNTLRFMNDSGKTVLVFERKG